MILKISNTKSAKPKNDRVEVDNDGKDKYNDEIELDGRSEVDDNKIGDNRVAKEKNHQKTGKMSKYKKTIRSLDFFTFGAKLVFIKLS